jgi:DNA-binding LacI/PurR family transcriptional regulator
MSDLERCYEEQKRAADYLIEHGHDRGAALGLSDWMAEECFIRSDYQRFEEALEYAETMGTAQMELDLLS